MIIKSMARKEPSFGQLINYMSDVDKADEKYHVYHNLFTRNQQAMEEDFLDNARKMHKRKNGNYLYHEILSITKTASVDERTLKQSLRDIAHEYVQRRASHNMVFGVLHDDHDYHLHYHLLISANQVGESKKTRLSKAEFDTVKKSLEHHVLSNYPELEQTVTINKTAEEKLSRKGAERKRRTGETPQRDKLKEKLESIFDRCATKDDFFRSLEAEKMSLYVRGKTIGVTDNNTGRNHRLKTLGLLDRFEQISQVIEQSETKEKQQENQQDPETEGHTHQKSNQEKDQGTKSSDAQADPIKEQEQQRKEEMEAFRKKQSSSKSNKQDKPQ